MNLKYVNKINILAVFSILYITTKTSQANTSLCQDVHRGINSLTNMTRLASVANNFDVCKSNVENSVAWIEWIFENNSNCTCPASYKFLQRTWKLLYSLNQNENPIQCKSTTKQAYKNSASALFYISNCYNN